MIIFLNTKPGTGRIPWIGSICSYLETKECYWIHALNFPIYRLENFLINLNWTKPLNSMCSLSCHDLYAIGFRG